MRAKHEAFEDHREEIKEQNNARCFMWFMSKNKSNVFKAWVNITKYYKLQKQKEREFLMRQEKLRKSLAIRFWQSRLEKTRNYRSREQVLINKLNKLRKKAVIRGLKDQFKSVSHLAKSLSNLEAMMRNKVLTHTFKTINTFANSRMDVHSNDKMVGTQDIMRMIRQSYYKKLRNAFQKFLG